MEQITLNEKINTGDGTKIISIIIYIKHQKTGANWFLTVKLLANESTNERGFKFLLPLSSHVKLII